MPRKKKDKKVTDKGKTPPIGAQLPLTAQEIQDLLKQLVGTLSQQTGSSTQSNTGSYTKKTQTPGSSTQKSDKKTLKSHVQNLPSQKWSQKQEYDLINHQSTLQLAQTKPPIASSQKHIVMAPSQAITIQPIKKTTPYVQKTGKTRLICQVEPEFYEETPNLTALKIFPTGWHFMPVNPKKNREYYELILIHSESVVLSRKPDPKDESLITHSTLQIKKILTPSQWGSDLNKHRSWDTDFESNGYSYWDYQDAWWNIFWDQNKFFNHSWFISFDKSTKYKFPQWFLLWWDFFGVIPEVFPPHVNQAFELFKQKFNLSVEPVIPMELHYFSKLSGAWIFSWQYSFSHQERSAPVLPLLQRIPFARWSEKFNTKFINTSAVQRWFTENPAYLCLSEQNVFLNQKARIQSKLAGVDGKQDLLKQLNSRIKYYSLHHQILLVGEGDFSFSLCLAQSFGSAFNVVASSLDTHDDVRKKYKEAKSNLDDLQRFGACVLHGVDATKMKLHSDLKMRTFDIIIFNFPHAGFHGKEDSSSLIQKHQSLVRGFFMNARSMLRPNGEIHVNHKTTEPFSRWNIKKLGKQSCLRLIECVDFKKEDYPGYNNKRGDGSTCDEPFPLGKCSTFKFSVSTTTKKPGSDTIKSKRSTQ